MMSTTSLIALLTLLALVVSAQVDITTDKFMNYSEKEQEQMRTSQSTEAQFTFEGRWEDKSKLSKFHFVADLPCSGVNFNV